ncbi:hypothetical protein [Parabacteroides pacaensis]|uniref:hypothetical protein n=1 Tax=Parabacteroides pacaensis TaxID=2086575 RepID=UPI0018FE998F|nr:hypothetical protein [Parabacteroides pacaensis]
MKNKKTLNLIAALQYQIQRYHATGNGVMCQLLTTKLRKLLNGDSADYCTLKD